MVHNTSVEKINFLMHFTHLLENAYDGALEFTETHGSNPHLKAPNYIAVSAVRLLHEYNNAISARSQEFFETMERAFA